MKISHVYHHYHPVLGGLERVVQSMAEEQVRMGYEVHVVTSTLGSKGEPAEGTVNDVHIHRAKAVQFGYPDLAYPLDGPWHVLRDSDIVHVHSQNSLFNIVTAKRAKKIGKAVLMDFLALDYLGSHTSPVLRFFGRVYQEKIQREAAKLAGSAVTLNARDQRILKRKYGLESRVVPHGIDETYLRRPEDDTLFRDKRDIHDGNIAAYVGRVHPSKGLDTLLKAAPLVTREVDDFVLVIAGGGSPYYKEKLTKLAEKLQVEHSVHLLGYIGETEKMSLLDSSKVFIFPTRHFGEAYPLVVDEAYARGTPVVATNVGVLPLRIKHMETGMLVPPDDPSSLAEALVTLLKDDDSLKRMHRKLQRVKESLLTWRQVCERLDNAYEDLRQLGRQGIRP